MTNRQILDAAFALEPVDRPPALGGWIAELAEVLALTGAKADEYRASQVSGSIEAFGWLGVYGLTLVAENWIDFAIMQSPKEEARLTIEFAAKNIQVEQIEHYRDYMPGTAPVTKTVVQEVKATPLWN